MFSMTQCQISTQDHMEHDLAGAVTSEKRSILPQEVASTDSDMHLDAARAKVQGSQEG